MTGDLSPGTLTNVRIVLVEPAGPLNVGSVARVMKNLGLQRLVLVNPQCDPLGEEAQQMAVHAGDVLQAAERVPTLSEALRGCRRAIATTARSRAGDMPLEHPRAALPWLLQADPVTPMAAATATSEATAALIFGPEDRGLSNGELNHAQRFIRIPTTEVYPSLNLAQAVAICCYELAQSAEAMMAPPDSATPDDGAMARRLVEVAIASASEPPAPLGQLEGYYQQLEAILLQIGYLYPHTAASRMEKFRRLFNRAFPTSTEVAMLRGIFSQILWALGQQVKAVTPPDAGLEADAASQTENFGKNRD